MEAKNYVESNSSNQSKDTPTNSNNSNDSSDSKKDNPKSTAKNQSAPPSKADAAKSKLLFRKEKKHIIFFDQSSSKERNLFSIKKSNEKTQELFDKFK